MNCIRESNTKILECYKESRNTAICCSATQPHIGENGRGSYAKLIVERELAQYVQNMIFGTRT